MRDALPAKELPFKCCLVTSPFQLLLGTKNNPGFLPPEAREDMFRHTDIPEAPWMIFKSDNKKQARIDCIRYFLGQFDYSRRCAAILEYDPAIARSVEDEKGG